MQHKYSWHQKYYVIMYFQHPLLANTQAFPFKRDLPICFMLMCRYCPLSSLLDGAMVFMKLVLVLKERLGTY